MAQTPPIAPLVLGTMTFGDTTDEATATEIINGALDAGVTWIDTANVYVAGRSEEILGRALKGKEGITLATKVGQPHPDVGTEHLLSSELVRKAVEGSLRRLQREYVEILYLHTPDRSTPVAETLSAIAGLAAEGKVGALGISNYSAWQTAEVAATALEVGAPRLYVGQQMYNLVARRIEEEYQEYATTTDLPTMIYNPLAGGLLTGRYRFDQDASDGRFASARNAQQYRDRYWDRRLFDAVTQLTKIADDAGLPILELALRWTISRPAVQSVLLGGSRPSHVMSNIEALSRGPLDDVIVSAANAVGDDLRGPMPAYSR